MSLRVALTGTPIPHRMRALTHHAGTRAARELGSTAPASSTAYTAAADAIVPNEQHITASTMAVAAATAEVGGGGGAMSSPGAAAASGASGSDAARTRATILPADPVDAARARDSFDSVYAVTVIADIAGADARSGACSDPAPSRAPTLVLASGGARAEIETATRARRKRWEWKW